ncbi:hypothetical protein, conserved [Babesia ovata]|uniref:C3H1-type domain-containing protein n=1 Tax=Babesia ovata TaxID=189622 RepID=A0A2H6KKI0_9APIC|nr:uncharacterized protein BOVATA_049800 [Babesia ovata]GBE63487.1 hypothetical protein, conserved [Babesia ovata]
MAFLHSVLKDVHAKQPYSVGKKQLKDNVVDQLGRYLCSGHEGFKSVIGQVAAGVRGYNREVERSNTAVKTIVTGMQRNMESLQTQVSGILKDHSDAGDFEKVRKAETSIHDRLTDCLSRADTFEKEMYNAQNKVLDLNSNLRNNIFIVKNNILRERDSLSRLAKKQQNDLNSMADTIREALEFLRICVKDQIKTEIKKFVEELIRLVKDIKSLLVKIRDTLEEYEYNLKSWMKEATKVLEGTIRDTELIINMANGGKDSWKKRVEDAVKELERKTNELTYYVDAQVKPGLKGLVTEALTAVKTMDDELKQDLFGVREAIKSKVDAITERIGALYKVIDPQGNGVSDDQKKKIEKIFQHIKGRFNEISGSGVRSPNGLNQIVQAVQGYVGEYSRNFESTVKIWVDDILKLESDEPLKTSLGFYLNQDAHFKTGFQKKGLNIIRDTVKEKIVEHVKSLLGQPPLTDDKVDLKLTSIQSCLNAFAQKLQSDISGNASTIVQLVENVIRDTQSSSRLTYDKSDLTQSVEMALATLASTARQAGEQVKTLAQKCKLVNINSALSAAKELFGKVENAVGQNHGSPKPGQPGTAQAVDLAIKAVSDTLDAQLPEDKPNKVSIKNTTDRTVFEHYKQQVDQASLTAATTNIYKLDGALPAAIKEIGAEASSITVEEITRDVSNLSSAITNNVNSLTKSISETANDGVRATLKLLRDANIGHSLTMLKGKFQDLRKKYVNMVIQDADSFITSDVPRLERECISTITNYVDSKINDAKNKLTHQARKHYVTSIRKMLQAFSSKIRSQLFDLPAQIEEDLRVGFKGFMKTLEGKVEDIDGTPTGKNINKLKSLTENSVPHLSIALHSFFTTVRNYVDQEIKRVHQQEYEKKNPPTPNTPEPYAARLDKVYTTFSILLTHITDTNRYDHLVPGMLDAVESAITALTPKDFANPNTAILDGVRKGLGVFVAEMKKVYISKYDSQVPTDVWVIHEMTSTTKGVETQDKFTEEGRKAAKVLLTITSTLYEQLHFLYYHCSTTFSAFSIDGTKYKNDALQTHFEKLGYDIPNLINKNNTGDHVAKKLREAFFYTFDFKTYPDKHSHPYFEIYLQAIRLSQGPLSLLYWSLADYFKACHFKISVSKIYPCSIKDMSAWICGLPYTLVFTQINGHCKKQLNVQNKSTGKFPNKDDPVIGQALRYNLSHSLYATCQITYNFLTTIQGHGRGFDQADYPYACNFCDNSRNFYYPQSVTELLDMLKDICTRLLSALNLLRTRCKYDASLANGWADCSYGQGIPGYQWNCNKPTGQSNSKPRCQPNDQPNCQPKSPLQAHLTDQLPGWLPHKLESVGCSAKCYTCPKASRGQQCITPMGFWDLTSAGSKEGLGKEIYDVLSDMCGNADSPLCSLLRCLIAMLPSPPRSLGDMFAFYCNGMQRWNGTSYDQDQKQIDQIDKCVRMSFPFSEDFHNNFQAEQLTVPLRTLHYSSSDHSGAESDAITHSDLSSITVRSKCRNAGTCGPYIQPLCFHAQHSYAQKHAGLFISWYIHLAWQLWDLLKELFDAFKGIECKAHGCSKCACKSGKHGDKDACKCNSVAQCGGVLPTLYKYGFTFGNAKSLHNTKRCDNFCAQLRKVIESNYFSTIFTAIDDFIFAIRAPFTWTLVALWSLSLLYLLHIAVVRLDVLRIRSHLKSPASHRIAAQSLLAAARVRALANVKYFSP